MARQRASGNRWYLFQKIYSSLSPYTLPAVCLPGLQVLKSKAALIAWEQSCHLFSQWLLMINSNNIKH